MRKPNSILEDLLEQGVSLITLKEMIGEYHKPLYELIRESSFYVKKAEEPWKYKSLSEKGIEDFCINRVYFWDGIDRKAFSRKLVKSFSDSICLLVDDAIKGLRLFVKDGENFRPATLEDEDYKYVIRLYEDNSLFDLEFAEPPNWARNLYLNQDALEVYEMLTNNLDYILEKKGEEAYRKALNIRRSAIDNYLNHKNSKDLNLKKADSTRRSENLLRALTAIAIDDYGYDPESPKSNAPQDIAEAMSKQGISFDAKTIRNWLKEGATLLPSKRDKN